MAQNKWNVTLALEFFFETVASVSLAWTSPGNGPKVTLEYHDEGAQCERRIMWWAARMVGKIVGFSSDDVKQLQGLCVNYEEKHLREEGPLYAADLF